MAGLIGNIANSAQLRLELGLSLAKNFCRIFCIKGSMEAQTRQNVFRECFMHVRNATLLVIIYMRRDERMCENTFRAIASIMSERAEVFLVENTSPANFLTHFPRLYSDFSRNYGI